MLRAVSSWVLRALPFAIMTLLALNTLMGCWCGVRHDVVATAAPDRPVAERGIAKFGRPGTL